MITDRIRQILSWYESDHPGVLANLRRMLGTGTLRDTGKMVILPVDQGFEHGPARSFAPNPAGYNPHYHFELAIESGCNAYAAPLGFLEAGARTFAGEIPLILKLNNNDSLFATKNPSQAITGGIEHALRLGCAAIGYTIYPGSSNAQQQYTTLGMLAEKAKPVGLVVVVWSYPRGEHLSKEGETAIDVTCYAAQIACQLGAHIVKVKPPTEVIEQAEAKKVYEKHQIPVHSLTDRIRHVVQSSFDGRRIVIFSGGAVKDEAGIFDECKSIHAGGGFGSIMGRNAFQRPKKDALVLLKKVMDIYAGK